MYKEYIIKRSLGTLGYYRRTSFMDGRQRKPGPSKYEAETLFSQP